MWVKSSGICLSLTDLKRESSCTVRGIVHRCGHYGKQYRVPQKVKNRATSWPSNSTSGYLSQDIQNSNSKRYMHPYGHSSTLYNSQDMKATSVLPCLLTHDGSLGFDWSHSRGFISTTLLHAAQHVLNQSSTQDCNLPWDLAIFLLRVCVRDPHKALKQAKLEHMDQPP